MLLLWVQNEEEEEERKKIKELVFCLSTWEARLLTADCRLEPGPGPGPDRTRTEDRFSIVC
jgi:hypothetical protein